MKLSHFLSFLLVALSAFSFAHDANKAFFTIQQKENRVEVQAEFPWSIRNAVLEAYPELENSNDKTDFEAAFFKYVNANFKIKNGDVNLTIISITEEIQDGHSHQNNFIFRFKVYTFDFISNTLMFNIYDNQKNYNDVILKSESLEFMTTPDEASFIVKVESKNNLENRTKIGIGLFSFCVFILALWWYNKKTKKV